MSHYKLFYFPGRGRGEAIRYIFAQAGVAFEDVRVSMEEWGNLKPKMPFGQMPVLEVDGKQLAQSNAITHYLAKKHGLVPSDDFQAAYAEMLVEGLNDVFPSFRPVIMALISGNEPQKEEAWKKFTAETLPSFMNRYEKFIKDNNTGWFVGDKVTWADLVIGEFLDRLEKIIDPNVLTAHPGLKSFVGRVHELPNIKKWVQSRPSSLF